MEALTVILTPIRYGWSLTLADGRELARFTGLAARRRALRYLARHDLGAEATDVR